jgi:hypothetical protein
LRRQQNALAAEKHKSGGGRPWLSSSQHTSGSTDDLAILPTPSDWPGRATGSEGTWPAVDSESGETWSLSTSWSAEAGTKLTHHVADMRGGARYALGGAEQATFAASAEGGLTFRRSALAPSRLAP